MGAYSAGREGSWRPTLTPREYISILESAVRSVHANQPPLFEDYRRGVGCLAAGQADRAVRVFSGLARQRPKDPVVHRLLGMAHLAAGHVEVALRHLAMALTILRRDARAELPLRDTVHAHLESALVRFVLLPLYARLGARDAVKRLMIDSLVL